MAIEDLPLLDRAKVAVDEMTMLPFIRQALVDLVAEVHRLQGEVYQAHTLERGVEDYLALRYADDPVEAFDLFVKYWVSPQYHAYLLDDDENDGEFVRQHTSGMQSLKTEQGSTDGYFHRSRTEI